MRFPDGCEADDETATQGKSHTRRGDYRMSADEVNTTRKRILFCTDFSENADVAFAFAVRETQAEDDCELILLRVIPEPDAQFWKTYIYEIEDIDAKAKNDIDAKVDSTYRSRIPEGVSFRVEFRIGRDYIKILEFAREYEVDLIVIGRQGPHRQSMCGSINSINSSGKV